MQQLFLISVALFAIHQHRSHYEVDGGCPASEKNGKQDWRFAVFERKEKGILILNKLFARFVIWYRINYAGTQVTQ